MQSYKKMVNGVVVDMSAEEIAEYENARPTEADRLQQAKDDKCELIDTATKESIIAVVGNEAKQRNYLAKYNELLEKKIDGVVLTVDEVNTTALIKSLWLQVETLATQGNAKEAQVQTYLTIEQVEAEVV